MSADISSFPDDDTVLILHSIERQIPYVVPRQFLRQSPPRRVRTVYWFENKQLLEVFQNWLYKQEIRDNSGKTPSDGQLIELAIVAGVLGSESLHNDILDALQHSHLGKTWDECASINQWDYWKEHPRGVFGGFWKKLSSFLIDRAAADIPANPRVPERLNRQMRRALKDREIIREARGKSFSAMMMSRYYLSAVVGESWDNPVDLSDPGPESISSKETHGSKRRTFVKMMHSSNPADESRFSL